MKNFTFSSSITGCGLDTCTNAAIKFSVMAGKNQKVSFYTKKQVVLLFSLLIAVTFSLSIETKLHRKNCQDKKIKYTHQLKNHFVNKK